MSRLSTLKTHLFTPEVISLKLKAIVELMKLRLTFLVLFSGLVGYWLAPSKDFDTVKFFWFAIGSFLITASSNIINQVFEIDYDRRMSRTSGRPLPSGRVSVPEAVSLSFTYSFIGAIILLFQVNILACLLTLLSQFLYGFVYTPLKRNGSLAVFVGAFPGALPTLIGWAAASGSLSSGAWAVFAIQFIWQFPHFWSIAWLLDDDYEKVGYRLLPHTGKPGPGTASQMMYFTFCLIPMSFLPWAMGVTGIISCWVAVAAGIWFFYKTIRLKNDCTHQAAKQLLLASVIYLPIIQIAYMIDKV